MRAIFSLLFVVLFVVFMPLPCFASALPSDVKTVLKAEYERYKNDKSGKNADYIPELAKVNSDYFAIVVVTAEGEMEAIGDADVPFAIESISKAIAFGLALEDQGESVFKEKVGLNPTGQPFNSVTSIEEQPGHLQNPFVNAGAIQTSSLISGKNSEEKWNRMLSLVRHLSDNKPYLGNAVYQSEMATNKHNRAIAALLDSYGLMHSDSMDAVDRYTKACSIMITTKELGLIGASLANGGINPITHQRVLKDSTVRNVLSEMVMNGLYETSGNWWWSVGLPAKSGVGGGIVAVVPGRMAIAVFSPPLDKAGNSVRAQAVIKDLSDHWKLHLLNRQQ